MDTIVPGALAAFAVDVAVYPLDTVKSRVQAADYSQRFPNGRGLYRGLWQGFGPVVLATLPSASLFFTTYEHTKHIFASPNTPYIGHILEQDHRAMALAHGACSALAELASCVILTPAETIKQQRQVYTPEMEPRLQGQGNMVTHAVNAMASPRALFRGYWALAGRNLPFTAMQFPLYEYFRGHIARAVHLPPRKSGLIPENQARAGHQEHPVSLDDVNFSEQARQRAYRIQQKASTSIHEPHSWRATVASSPPAPSSDATSYYGKAGLVSATSAACAGALSALITTPLDLIKTRIMLDSDTKRKTQGVIQVGWRIWKREGLPGLMRGGLLRSSWTALGAGIYLGSYEAGREWWNTMGREQSRELASVAEDSWQDVRSRS